MTHKMFRPSHHVCKAQMPLSRRGVFGAIVAGTALAGVGYPVRAVAQGAHTLIEIRAGNAEDFAAVIARGLADTPPTVPVTIRFEPGTYHLRPTGLARKQLYISNNDDGEKPVGLLFEGRSGVTIEGNGATIRAHGELIPVAILGSSNVAISDLVLTWDRPFHCEGDVLSAGPGFAEMRIPDAFDYEVQGGKFKFANEPGDHNILKNLLEFDREKRESRFQTYDNFLRGYSGSGDLIESPYTVREIGPRTVRFELPFKTVPLAGNRMLIMPHSRHYSAVVVQRSREIAFTNVHIGCSGAMGIIAQTSHNLSLTRCSVSPVTDDHFVSTAVDATHFVNCSGQLEFTDCEFSNHIDDAINVHGIYVRIIKVLPDGRVRVEFSHRQQRGVGMLAPRDVVAIDDGRNLNTLGIGEISEFTWEDAQYAHVRFSGIDLSRLKTGDVINNLSRQAAARVKGCRIGKNRARGLLMSTAGKVEIIDNVFHTPGTAVRVSGGVDKWYESGPTRDVTIARNTFDNCKYGVWGRGLFDIVAVDDRPRQVSTPYHANVTIAQNDIHAIDRLMVSAYRVGSLTFSDNRIARSDAYPEAREIAHPFELSAVESFEASGNIVSGFVGEYAQKFETSGKGG